MVLFAGALLVERKDWAGITHHSETVARTRVYMNVRATQIIADVNDREDSPSGDDGIFLIVEPVLLSQLPLVPSQKHQQQKKLGGEILRCDIHVDFLDGTSSNLPDLLGDLQQPNKPQRVTHSAPSSTANRTTASLRLRHHYRRRRAARCTC
jgi:hypothetical protein